jgi:hypothetical protein
MATMQEELRSGSVAAGCAEQRTVTVRLFRTTESKDRSMPRAFALTFLVLAALCGFAQAQGVAPDRPGRVECPPGAGPNAPAVGGESNKTLSDQLAQSKGVICPPAGVDPEMQQQPQQGGTLKVIPPPGSPGGNPSVQPK